MHKPFSPRMLGTFVFILLLSTLVACTRSDSQTVIPAASHQQLFQIQGKIQQGPSAGLSLNGELRATVDSAGRLRGALTPETGSAITVTGQIDGQAIHLSFDLGNDVAVLGVGTLQHTLDHPQGTAGGMLTGPQPGDSGDWFARWTTITIPKTPAPSITQPSLDSPLLTVFYILLIVLVVWLVSIWLRWKQKNLFRKSPGRSSIPFVKASAQTLRPERWPDEATLPLAQFATIYAHGDDHYDLSFTIESARGEFLGECGVGISATTTGSKLETDFEAAPEVSGKIPSADDALAFLTRLAASNEDQLRAHAKQEGETRMAEIMGRKPTKTPKAKTAARPEPLVTATADGKHKAVTALEVWIFDKNDINTTTKVLRSARGFYDPSQRSSRDRVDKVLVIEPDQTVVLETKTLRMRVKVSAVEYLSDAMVSSSAFNQVSLKLAVWIK